MDLIEFNNSIINFQNYLIKIGLKLLWKWCRRELVFGACRCLSAEHGDNELELGSDEILVDGLTKKGIKEQNQLEVAIGDGMEFTIHGDLKDTKSKKSKFLNNTTVIIINTDK